MRLIYADTLQKDIVELPNCPNGYSDTYDKATILGVIDEQPTVDAIPVEWLEARYPIHDTFRWESDFHKAYAIYEVIKEWSERKEE